MSKNAVSVAPSRNAGWRSTLTSSSRLVCQAVQAGAGQRVGEHQRRLPARGSVRDDFGEHRVVVDRHHRSVDDAGVQPDPGPLSQRAELGPNRRHVDRVHRAGLRLPAVRRILGIQPGLDRMALGGRRFGIEAIAIGDRELQLDEIEPGGLFGDRVFDLQPGVHLQEVELAVVVGEELDGSRRRCSRSRRRPAGRRRTAWRACPVCAQPTVTAPLR